MSNCERCTKTQKKYKLLETDLLFQIKKLHQDMAALKITLQIAHQKQLKKHIEKINQEKLQKEGQAKCWMQKYDSMIIQYELKLKKTKQTYEMNILKIKEESNEINTNEMKQKQAKITYEKNILKQKQEQQINKLKIEKEQQKKKQQKKYEDEINKILSLHRQQSKQIELEKTILNEKIKQLLQKQESITFNMYELNQELKRVKQELAKTKEQMQDKSILFKVKIQMKDKEIENLKKQTTEKIKNIQNQFNKQKEIANSEHKRSMKKMMENSMKTIEEYQQRIQQIDKIRQNQLKIYHENLEIVKKISEQAYVPKNKFHQEINTLNVKLINKEKDVERAKHEIKQCKLEIFNKEETYIKFFPNPNNNYVSTAPDIYIRSPNEKRKEYSIKKHHRGSFNLTDNSPLLKSRSNESSTKFASNKSSTKMASIQCLQKLQVPQIEAFDMF